MMKNNPPSSLTAAARGSGGYYPSRVRIYYVVRGWHRVAARPAGGGGNNANLRRLGRTE